MIGESEPDHQYYRFHHGAKNYARGRTQNVEAGYHCRHNRNLWLVMATLLSGQVATYPALPWYEQLAASRASIRLSWAFAEVWATTMCTDGLCALSRASDAPALSGAYHALIVLFVVMLMLNAAWAWMFFGARSPLLGLINIVIQLAVVVATAAAFWKIDKIAALCLVPLAGWVAFAAVLNFAIWRLNGLARAGL